MTNNNCRRLLVDAELSDGREQFGRVTQHQSQSTLHSLANSTWSSYCAQHTTQPVQSLDILEENRHLIHQVDTEQCFNTIPTAVVKPKYQKILHDDRQLLTNAGGFVDYYKSASNNNNFPGSYNNLCVKRVNNNKLQAAFEEASRRKTTASISSAGLKRGKSSSSSSNAIVGVVTPRKKNSNEIRVGAGNKMDSDYGVSEVTTDFNENNVISDKNNGRSVGGDRVQQRTTSRRTSSAKENSGAGVMNL